jgi:cytochrome c553
VKASQRCSALRTAALVLVVALAGTAGAQQPQKKSGAARPAGNSAPAAAKGTDYAQRFTEVCATCHGPKGRSDLAHMPVLAGQPSLYVATQLFLFREGRRSNSDMTAVAKTLTDGDLRGFSDFVGTLPPLPAPPRDTAPDAALMRKGEALAQQHKCFFCHGADLSGGQQVARIAGQGESYLKTSLQGFRSGTRPGYTQAMTAAVGQIPPEDLDTLAYYVSRFSGPPGK